LIAWPIRLAATGDHIVIEITVHSIDLLVDDDELERCRSVLVYPEPRCKAGVLAKFARRVS
jgi:dihydroxyacid dehydratase/phosphogluconate dehydratase